MVYHHFPHENRNFWVERPPFKRPETTYGHDSDQLSPTAVPLQYLGRLPLQQPPSSSGYPSPKISSRSPHGLVHQLVNVGQFHYNVGPPFDSEVGEHNSNNYGLWYANNYNIHGLYKPTNKTEGGPHRSISLGIMIGGCICHGVQVNPLDHGSTLKLAWTGVFCGAACSFLNMLFYPEHASSKWSTNTSTKTRDKLPFDMFHVFSH